ncbi:uncharacterized protein [Trachinotus anak]|uniref:uncharacterized protein n=1 Tax=Trachinotus anak TaxID=443729 RepID=UPI0039F18881
MSRNEVPTREYRGNSPQRKEARRGTAAGSPRASPRPPTPARAGPRAKWPRQLKTRPHPKRRARHTPERPQPPSPRPPSGKDPSQPWRPGIPAPVTLQDKWGKEGRRSPHPPARKPSPGGQRTAGPSAQPQTQSPKSAGGAQGIPEMPGLPAGAPNPRSMATAPTQPATHKRKPPTPTRATHDIPAMDLLTPHGRLPAQSTRHQGQIDRGAILSPPYVWCGCKVCMCGCAYECVSELGVWVTIVP